MKLFHLSLYVLMPCMVLAQPIAITTLVVGQYPYSGGGGGGSVPNPNVFWYKFAEGSGFTTSDSSGNGYTGGLTNFSAPGNSTHNPQWSTGPTGHGAMTFDLGNENLIVTSCNSTLNDFTVSAWFLVTSGNVLAAQYQRIVDKSYTAGFFMGHSGTSADVTQWGGGVIESSPPYGVYAAFTLGQWNMLTMVRSGTTESIYVNGVFSSSATVTSSATSGDFLQIGGDLAGVPNDCLTGSVADVAGWNSALSSGQITAWYNQGAH